MVALSLRGKLAWLGLIYFASGFPFGVVKDALPVYFRLQGLSLTDIGLMSLLGLPWTLKALWAPLVDRFGERWQWIAGALGVMAVVLVCLPYLAAGGASTVLWVALLAFTVASATQDVAIDAYFVGLMAHGEEGKGNALRVTAYRIALIAAGGGLVVLAGQGRWPLAFLVAAGCLVALIVVVVRAPRVEVPAAARAEQLRPMLAWLRLPGAWAVFAFALLYKLGDAAMGPMVKPFWLSRGLGPAEIGLVSTSLGVVATIAGAVVGGRLTDRWGIFKAVWVLGLAQAGSNLCYAGVASLDLPLATGELNEWSVEAAAAIVTQPVRLAIYGASVFESFTAGLGLSPFMALLMRVCDKTHAATQYAILSATFALSRDLAGAASGWATDLLGYGPYFTFTFVLALPAYALLPWVRRRLEAST